MNLCPECEEPLDDFSPCACVLGYTRNPVTAQKAQERKDAPNFAGGMRRMVHRKLAREGKLVK